MALAMTFNAASGSTALTNGTPLTTNGTVDLSAKYEGQVTVAVTAGPSVSTTAGVQVDVYAGSGTGPTYDTQPVTTVVIPVTTPTAVTSATIFLGPGKYRCQFSNLDASNTVGYTVAVATVDSV